MNRLSYLLSVLWVAGFLLFLSMPFSAFAEGPALDVLSERDSLYNNYDKVKQDTFRRYGALNPDGSVNKNAPGYGAAVKEIKPHHDRMMDRARELGSQRERVNQRVYEVAGAASPQTSGTDPMKGGGRGVFGDAEGTARSVRDYERIAKGFEDRGYHVDRQPDYIKVEKLDTVIHRPAGSADAVGGSAHEARVTAQTHGPETGGSAYGQHKYQGQGGEYSSRDSMGAGLDSIKKIQDAVDAEPRTPLEKYQRDQIIAKETNRIREAAGLEKDPHLERVKQGMDPDLMPEIKDPVKQTALDQTRRSWPEIEKRNQQNLADLDRAISNARTPEEAHRLRAERNDIINRQEGTRNAVVERDGGRALREVTGRENTSAKPLPETSASGEKPAGGGGKTVRIGDQPPVGGKETVRVKGPVQQSRPGNPPGFFDKHPIEKNVGPIFNGEPGKVMEFMRNNGGKLTLALTAAQTMSCLAQGKEVSQCAIELVEGFGVSAGIVLVLGPTGAAILGGTIGAYQIYEAGVEATKQWADAEQRRIAYEHRERQTEYNRGALDRYLRDFREKRIYGELQASTMAVSGACNSITADIRSAVSFSSDDADKIINLADLIAAVKSAGAACSGMSALVSEIAQLRSRSKTYEETVIKGLDWAQAKANKCKVADDADKIKSMFDKCTGLAADIKGYSLLAHKKNTRITETIDKAKEAQAALATMQAMSAKMIEKTSRLGGVKSSVPARIASAKAQKKTHLALSTSVLGEIDRLRQAFPDTILPVHEQGFDELRGLVEKYKTPVCDPDMVDWSDELKRLDDAGRQLGTYARGARLDVEHANTALEPCRNLATADQAVEVIDASANWVLTAIGMNDDLPRKADDCLAKLKLQKNPRIASVKCPPNSTFIPDEDKQKALCRCDKGYKWNDDRTACVADKAAQVAAANCSSHPNSRPYWDEKENKPRCKWCNPGYVWKDAKNLDCVPDKAALVARADCSGTPKSRPYWDEKESKVKCLSCKPGYRWKDAQALECVTERKTLIAQADCSGTPNSRAYWDEKENKTKCRFCKPGFVWKDAKSLECIAEKAALVARADCSGTPNSRAYWDDEYNEVRCKYCNEGNHWRDGSSLDCVADNPGDNGLSNIDVGQIANQIINANRRYQGETNRINDEYNANRRTINQPPPRAKGRKINPFCDGYARTAVQQYQQSVSQRCGFSDRRWQASYDNHYGWCNTASKSSAESETKARTRGLLDCSHKEPR